MDYICTSYLLQPILPRSQSLTQESKHEALILLRYFVAWLDGGGGGGCIHNNDDTDTSTTKKLAAARDSVLVASGEDRLPADPQPCQ